MSKTNVYINSRGKNLNVGAVESVARWVGQMLRVFGLGEGESSEIGWGQQNQGDGTFNVCLLPHACLASHLLCIAGGSSHALS